MVLEDALKTGYGVTTTKSRLVLRSGYDMPETYVENVSGNSSATFISLLRARTKVVPALQVNGVPMKIIRVTTYFKRQWSVTMLDTVAACPTGMCIFSGSFVPYPGEPLSFLKCYVPIKYIQVN